MCNLSALLRVRTTGKHANWSLGTDTGLNLFHPGTTDESQTLFTAAVACLTYGLNQHSELVRCSVAHAGNDHRLGAQEAPPAIISMSPGAGFEKHVDAIIAGGPLLGYTAEKGLVTPGCSQAEPVQTDGEDRNRTAPFPFCSNRFEFRAVGSSQNCAFPVMVCNTIMAAGLAHLSSLLESGVDRRDAVAQLYRENRAIIFTGNSYSEAWSLEAEKRGLPNLTTTPQALPTFNSAKAKTVLSEMGVSSEAETDSRAEVMWESYVIAVKTEVETMIKMVNTGFLPACAKDVACFATAPDLAADRAAVFSAIQTELGTLLALKAKLPHDSLVDEANYLSLILKPQMAKLRAAVDAAEETMDANLYPFPTYEDLLYGHQF